MAIKKNIVISSLIFTIIIFIFGIGFGIGHAISKFKKKSPHCDPNKCLQQTFTPCPSVLKKNPKFKLTIQSLTDQCMDIDKWEGLSTTNFKSDNTFGLSNFSNRCQDTNTSQIFQFLRDEKDPSQFQIYSPSKQLCLDTNTDPWLWKSCNNKNRFQFFKINKMGSNQVISSLPQPSKCLSFGSAYFNFFGYKNCDHTDGSVVINTLLVND